MCGLQGFCFYTYEIGNQESLILCLTFNVCKNDEKNLEESFLFFYEVINKVVLNQQTNVYNLIPDKLDQNGITTFTISDPKYCTEKKYGQIAQALYEIFKDISGFSLRRSYGKFIIEYPDDIQTQLLYRENIRSIIRKKLLASDFSKRRPLCDNLKAVSDLLSGVQKVKSCDHACLDEFLFWKKESQNSKTVVGNPTFSTSSLSFFNSSSSSGNPDGKSPKLDIKTLLNPS